MSSNTSLTSLTSLTSSRAGSNKKLIMRAVSVVMALCFIYLAFYVVGKDKDQNGNDDQMAKVMNVVIKFLLCIAAVLILVAG